jgi:hypothetical protein
MLGLALWSAIEPGLAMIAMSLASLRPLIRIFSRTVSSLRSSNSNNSTAKSSTKHAASPQNSNKEDTEQGTVDLHPNARKLPFLDTANTMDSMAATTLSDEDYLSSETAVAGEAMSCRIKRGSWWRPHSFNAGLFTEIQDEMERRGPRRSEIELGGFEVPKLRNPVT